ncbi:phosphatase, partial [filamentous cyanobacterium CCP5]
MMTVLFWDIDGTLLTTGRAGIFALEDAAVEVIGHPVNLSQLKTAGLTDVEIAREILSL